MSSECINSVSLLQDCLFQYLIGRYCIQDITAPVVFDFLTSLIEHHSQHTVGMLSVLATLCPSA